ncbi:MAG: AmmeMemoRadiSam system protein B [FCB group bacterium]|jgi:AmmeMemoRadiSam system protein B
MKNSFKQILTLIIIIIMIISGDFIINSKNTNPENKQSIRNPVDTVGFATHPEQMDYIMKYTDSVVKQSGKAMGTINNKISEPWKLVISPHDDYTYVGSIYPELLSNIKAKTIILIGVCHKAKQFKLENKLVFDSYTHWKEPYGNVKCSQLREKIIEQLPNDMYEINDSMQAVEHSVEAIIPFLQYYNRNIEIISILVPYMPYSRMNEIAVPLSKAINEVTLKNHLKWGKDFAIIISNDAVHYGDQDWGGKNFALYGADSAGYKQAIAHENEIINSCLTKNITLDKIRNFVNYTVKENDFKEYKWTWCGRYSVPFGLLTSYYLQSLMNIKLSGTLIKYATSIDHTPIPVDKIGMGVTAPANIHHWVGYAAIGYK